MKQLWLQAACCSVLLACASGAAYAGTLTATVTGIPPIVAVSPVSPTPASTISPTVMLAHTGIVSAPDFTAVSVSLAFNTAELSFIGTATSGWSCVPSPGLVVCSGPDIPVNTAASLVPEFTVRAGSGTSGTQIVASPFGSDGGTPTLVNGQANFTVTDRTDLGLSSPTSVTVPLGGSTPVSIDVIRNPSDANHPANLWTNLRVGLNFPATLRYGGATAAGWTCPPGSGSPGGTFQCVRASNATGSSPESIIVQVFGVIAGSGQSLTAQLQHDSGDVNTGNNSALTQVDVGALEADLSVQVQAPPSALNGTNFSVVLDILNSGPGLATMVQGDLTLDPSLIVSSVASGCSLQSPTLYRCTAPSLASGSTASFAFTVRHTQPVSGPVGGSVVVSAAEADSNVSNNATSFSVGVLRSADLSVSLSDSPDPVEPGANFVVNAVVRNSGIDVANNVQLVFQLPSNASYVDAPVPTGSGTVMTCTQNSAQVECVASQLAVGQNALAAIRLTAPSSGSVVTTAAVTAEEPDASPADNNASATTTVVPPARLSLRKVATASTVAVGSEFGYTITATNIGSVAATGVVLLDTIPAGQSIVTVDGGSFNCTTSGQAVDCRLQSLAAGAAGVVNIRVSAPPQPGTVSNTASVSSTQIGTPVSASATVEFTTAPAVVDLQLTKTDSVDPVSPGAAFEYELRVTNNGTADAAGFVLSDTLPTGVILSSATGSNWSCSGSQVVSCAYFGALAVNASSSVRLAVRAPLQVGALSNTASVSVLPGELNVTDNTDSENTTVRDNSGGSNLPDLSLRGSFDNSTPASGQEVRLNLVARNNDSSIESLGPVLCGQVVGPAGGFAIQELSAAGVMCSIAGNGGQVSCTIPRLGAGQELAFVGTARTGANTPVGATVGLDLQIGCGITDVTPMDNSLSLRATIAAAPVDSPADVSVVLTASANTVPLSEAAAFQVDVRNAGVGVASGIVVATSLGSGFRYEGFGGAGWSCAVSAQSVNCQRAATLPAQSSSVLTINTTAIGPPGRFDTVAVVSTSSVDPVASNNRAQISTQIGAATDAESIAESLSAAAAMDPIAGDAAPVVADICANPVPELVGQCNALVAAAASGNQQEVIAGLRALFPEEVAAQSVSLSQAAATQFSNVDSRLNELRGGKSGFSASGFALGLGRQTLPLGMFSGLLDDSEADPEIGESGDLISPWGGFINGTLSRGEQDTGDGSRRVVADFQSYGVTAGVDYRKSARLVFGGALGYADFSSDITDGGALSTKGFTLTGYSAWYPRDRVYVDARLSYAMLDLDMRRRIQFESGGFALDRTATASTDSSQVSFASATGYHISRGTWTITPNGSLRYLRSHVDGFSEQGAGANNGIFGDQDIDSLQLTAGVQVNKVISLSNGVLTPQFDFSFSRELRDEDLVIEARLAGAAADQIFRVRAEEPDHSFANVGLGFVYIGPNGRQVFVSYRELLGAQGTDRGTLTIGGRFEF